MLTLFISSTYIDQREVRQRVYEIALASGFKVLRMENDEADPLLNRARRDHPDKWARPPSRSLTAVKLRSVRTLKDMCLTKENP
jgi:hypothetical protein